MSGFARVSRRCFLQPSRDALSPPLQLTQKPPDAEGMSERSALIEHCGVGGSVRKDTLYPIMSTKSPSCNGFAHARDRAWGRTDAKALAILE